ncbi:MAG: diguanylate cyclase [Coriobacteriia bacterium]|nr:diguanylate cyclase [Coriobacteriia bacterium]
MDSPSRALTTSGINRGIRRIAWVPAPLLAGIYAAVLFSQLSGMNRLAPLEAIYLVPIVASVVLSILASLRSSGAERMFWVFLAAANLMLAFCEFLLLWWVGFISPAGPPAISWPFQGLHVVAVMCFLGLVLAMTRLQDGRRPARIRFALDAAAVAVLIYVVLLGLYAHPLMSTVAAPASAALVGAAYPLAGLLLLFGALGNLAGFKFVRWRSWEALAVGAIVVYAIAVCLWPVWYLSVAETTRNVSRGVLDLVQFGGHYMLMMAAVYRLTEKEKVHLRPLPLPAFARRPWVSVLVPIASVLGILALAAARLQTSDSQWFRAYGVLVVILLALVLARSLLVALEHSVLARETVTDPLTGLPNHSYLRAILTREFDDARVYGEEMALAVLDIDDFHVYNERLGYEAGDRTLKHIGEVLQAATNDGTIVGRVDGDRFAIVFPLKGSSAAAVCCQQIVDKIEILVASSDGEVSISAGIASFPRDTEDLEELKHLAEGALYHAKRSGKNRVIIYEPNRLQDLTVKDTMDRMQRQSFLSSAKALTAALEARYPSSQFHSRRVAESARRLAVQLGLSDERVWLVEVVALLHDVGKISLPDTMMNAARLVGDFGREYVRQHTERGHDILVSAGLSDVVPSVRSHHERWDGTGLPDGLVGEEIPLEARIVAVCNAYEWMTSDRESGDAMAWNFALCEIEKGAGLRFDPAIAAAFVRMVSGEHAHAETSDQGVLSAAIR